LLGSCEYGAYSKVTEGVLEEIHRVG
jgi:hypothetical protein